MKEKSREEFSRILQKCVERQSVARESTVLVVGAGPADLHVLTAAGFRNLAVSNLPSAALRLDESSLGAERLTSLDVENLGLEDESYDLVFAHEVIHHCRSPHRALCEMIRVCRKAVIFQEPNDCLFMRALTSLRFSFPYELAAVVGNGYSAGGVRDSQIPNYIYRWNRREVVKCLSSFLAEWVFSVYAYPYWDFNATEEHIDLRRESRISSLTRLIGTRNFLRTLRFLQKGLNCVSVIRRQGNKFLCCISKSGSLQPWLKWNGDEIVFREDFGRQG